MKSLLVTILGLAVLVNASIADAKTSKRSAKRSKTTTSSVVKSKSKAQSQAQTSSQDSSLKSDFEGLGDNDAFLERAKSMNAESRTRIVQNRTVDLNNRFEIGGNYGINGGGDSYVTTQNLGAYLDFHFSPRWAVGVRYQHSYNKLTSEGEEQYKRAREAQAIDPASPEAFAGVDYPIDTSLFTVSYAPIYGKLNLFDSGIAHFDIYGLLGYGVMKLNSGNSNTYAAGIGSGIWLSQHFATRLEVRYQAFEDLIGTANRKQNIIQGMVSFGLLL